MQVWVCMWFVVLLVLQNLPYTTFSHHQQFFFLNFFFFFQFWKFRPGKSEKHKIKLVWPNGVVVGPSSPPVPGKIAEKIWWGEYVDLSMLLPHRLGAPEPTLAEALQKRTRDDKLITTIEQWVVCFSAYMSVLVLKNPSRIRDLLAYQALIVKAAHDYEGTPWLSYDAHFRSLAATMQLANWSSPDQTIWSQYFNRAMPKRSGISPLSVGPDGEANEARNEDRTMRGKLPLP